MMSQWTAVNIHHLQFESWSKSVCVAVTPVELWRENERIKEWLWVEGGREGGEADGSMPCPLGVTFLVNSSYDTAPPPSSCSNGRKIEKAETDLSTATSPHFISASLPFYNKKARCGRHFQTGAAQTVKDEKLQRRLQRKERCKSKLDAKLNFLIKDRANSELLLEPLHGTD